MYQIASNDFDKGVRFSNTVDQKSYSIYDLWTETVRLVEIICLWVKQLVERPSSEKKWNHVNMWCIVFRRSHISLAQLYEFEKENKQTSGSKHYL